MLTLEITTPQRNLLTVSCLSVSIPGLEGQFEVLPGHASLLAEVRTGLLSFNVAEAHEELADFGTIASGFRVMVADGFAEVANDEVRILCNAAALPSEVQATSEEDLIIQLKERMRMATEDSNKKLKRLGAEIKMALAQL